MLAARNQQENLVHEQQMVAASKPLNQGLKGAKTPSNKAPKTPFKVPLNDENATHRLGKSVLKTNGKSNENLMTGGKKGGNVDKSAFVTPAGPRSRAPLGMKTTNAKAYAFQTPAPKAAGLTPGKTLQPSRSPRLRRAKVKVLQAVPAQEEIEEEEEPDIEYMPPRGEPLPDLPDDEPELNLSMFQGKNFTRGLSATYLDPLGDDGLTVSERKALADKEEHDRKTDELFQKAIDDLETIVPDRKPGKATRKLTVAKDPAATKKPACRPAVRPAVRPAARPAARPIPRTAAPSTLTSRAAASALNGGTGRSTNPVRSFAAPTLSSQKSRGLAVSRKSLGVKVPVHSSANHARHAAATSASRSTIGYARGRASGGARGKLTGVFTTEQDSGVRASTVQSRSSSQATLTPARYREALKESEEEGIDEQLKSHRFGVADEGEDDVALFSSTFAEEDEFEGFQLGVPRV